MFFLIIPDVFSLELFAYHSFLKLYIYIYREREREKERGVRGVMVIIIGNGHGDLSSNPG